jgi:hypothetical protein
MSSCFRCRSPADLGGRQLSENEIGARDAEVDSQRTPDTTARRCGDTALRRHVGDPSGSSDSHRLSPRCEGGSPENNMIYLVLACEQHADRPHRKVSVGFRARRVIHGAITSDGLEYFYVRGPALWRDRLRTSRVICGISTSETTVDSVMIEHFQ